MPGGSVDNCITFQPVQNHVVIGDDSTIDFSKYYHFIPMPDLRAFANAGFPFSRMADLSQTITVMPKAPNEAQMETLLNTVGFIGAQTGFPAINLTVTDDGSTIQGERCRHHDRRWYPGQTERRQADRPVGAGDRKLGENADAPDPVPPALYRTRAIARQKLSQR